MSDAGCLRTNSRRQIAIVLARKSREVKHNEALEVEFASCSDSEEDAAEKGKSPVDGVCSVCFATPLYGGVR